MRNSDGRLVIYGEGGRVLAELAPVADSPEYEELAARIAVLLGPALPRVAVTYREGLLDEVRADSPCEVLLIEEDRYDDPPVTLRRRALTQGDPGAVDAVLTRIGAGPKAAG